MQEGKAPQEETQYWMGYYYLTLNHRTAAIGRSNAAGRSAQLIMELFARLKYRQLKRGDSYEFSPTQSQLADCLSLTPVHLNRILRNFHERRMLEIENEITCIFDVNELTRIADEEYGKMVQTWKSDRSAVADLTWFFWTKRFDRNCLGKEFWQGEEET